MCKAVQVKDFVCHHCEKLARDIMSRCQQCHHVWYCSKEVCSKMHDIARKCATLLDQCAALQLQMVAVKTWLSAKCTYMYSCISVALDHSDCMR